MEKGMERRDYCGLMASLRQKLGCWGCGGGTPGLDKETDALQMWSK